ncbi:MAG: hypothetical protein QOH70_4120 [Blastocatellia bacterium]|jgi:uncharacterized membrane protein|nr:hypothetical protein [Blastocatellia bacterium]
MATPYEPPTAPPSSAPGGTTSIGIDANLASMLCYLTMICCGLGIIVSLVFFIMEKTNRLLRFHAMQALLFGGVWIVVGIALRILSVLVSIGGMDLGFLIFWGLLLVRILVALFLLIFLLLAAIKAYQGQYYKLPIIGNIAWNIVNK